MPPQGQNTAVSLSEAQAASASQMGRFETETLALAANRAALADLNGQWIDRFHDRNGL